MQVVPSLQAVDAGASDDSVGGAQQRADLSQASGIAQAASLTVAFSGHGAGSGRGGGSNGVLGGGSGGGSSGAGSSGGSGGGAVGRVRPDGSTSPDHSSYTYDTDDATTIAASSSRPPPLASSHPHGHTHESGGLASLVTFFLIALVCLAPVCCACACALMSFYNRLTATGHSYSSVRQSFKGSHGEGGFTTADDYDGVGPWHSTEGGTEAGSGGSSIGAGDGAPPSPNAQPVYGDTPRPANETAAEAGATRWQPPPLYQLGVAIPIPPASGLRNAVPPGGPPSLADHLASKERTPSKCGQHYRTAQHAPLQQHASRQQHAPLQQQQQQQQQQGPPLRACYGAAADYVGAADETLQRALEEQRASSEEMVRRAIEEKEKIYQAMRVSCMKDLAEGAGVRRF